MAGARGWPYARPVRPAGSLSAPPRGKLFGIGLSRTGTRSVTVALARLGLRPIHYPFDAGTERELFDGAPRLTVLDNHDALLDLPAAAFFAQLDERYPGSRFVLTTRRRDAWLEAVQAHYAGLLEAWEESTPRFRAFGERITRRAYGAFPASRDDFAAAFDRHEAAVAAHFADRPGDLLRLDVSAGDAWAPLAAFATGGDPPAQPFPHVDDADEAPAEVAEHTVFRSQVRA